MRYCFLGILLVLLNSILHAQTITGTMVDPVESTQIPGVTLQLISKADTTIVKNQISQEDGRFTFSGISKGNYVLRGSAIGYEPLERSIVITDSLPAIDLGEVYMPKKTVTLEGVVVVSQPPAVTQKGDTTQYSASQYKTNPDATVEDLIKKMPGVTVDKSGNVTAQGEQVRKVTVDGRDFFGDDASMALKNLPAEVVDKIQVFDRLSDQAQLTGFDDGNSVRAINIVTRNQVRNGQFGRIFAGYGTDGRYTAGGNTSFFNGDRRISFLGNFNNINIQNFASQDLLGVTSGGGGGGRGGRGGGGGFGGNPFSGGQSGGINQTNAFGINYSDKWSNKLTVSGSYFFNNSKNETESETFSPTVTDENRRLNFNYNRNAVSNNNNHRFNMRFEYKLDSNNTIMYIPSWSFQNNSTSSSNYTTAIYEEGDSSYISDSKSRSDRNGFNVNNNLMYRRSFAKRGRSFSIGLQANFNKNDGESYNLTNLEKFEEINLPTVRNQYRTNPTNGSQYSARINYTEPVGSKGMMEFSYTPSVQINKRNQETFDYNTSNQDYTDFNMAQSNNFKNKITRNNAGVNYRLGQSRDNQFSVGLEAQHSKMESERIYPIISNVDQSFFTILPNLRWMRKVGRYSNLRVFYRANTSFPSIDQLQDVVDSSNQTSIIVGNPNLKQSYTHFGSARYTYTNTKTNHSFIANASYQAASNYITSDVNNSKGITNTTYVNLNGYNSFSGLLTYALPVQFLKSNFSINTSYGHTETPSKYNGEEGIVTRNNYGGGIGLSSNISEYIDFTLRYDISYNNTKSTLNNGSQGQNYINHSPGLVLNLLSTKGWFFNTSFNYENYKVEGAASTEFALWNAAVGKKFLKKKQAELKLSVFDILKQNNSFSQTVNNYNLVQTSTTKVLQQYFMLTFTYSLRNFGKGKANNQNEGERRERGEWRGGPPGGMPPGGGGPGMF